MHGQEMGLESCTGSNNLTSCFWYLHSRSWISLEIFMTNNIRHYVFIPEKLREWKKNLHGIFIGIFDINITLKWHSYTRWCFLSACQLLLHPTITLQKHNISCLHNKNTMEVGMIAESPECKPRLSCSSLGTFYFLMKLLHKGNWERHLR